MDDVLSLRIFLEVTRRQSFTATAEHFGISPSAVSKHVAGLEQTLKARLLHRTTKQMHLTRAGAFVAERGTDILLDLDDMCSAIAGMTGEVSGLIRVGAAPYFGAHRLMPMVAALREKHPDIEVSLVTLSQSRLEDIVGAGLDVGIVNTTRLPDMTHSAYTITELPQVAVASPAYLRLRGSPAEPTDLAQHECLINSYKSPTGTWRFSGPDGTQTSVRVGGKTRSSYGEALKMAAVSGMGISVHPRYMVEKELRDGSLLPILAGYEPEVLRVFAVYNGPSNLPQRVRTFIDFMREWDWAA